MSPKPKHHHRNTGPMLASPRCGARTRSGKPCRAPAVNGKKRCRMHGARPARARRTEIRMRSSTGAIPAKPLHNAGRGDDSSGSLND
ncbi:MAG: HGGxSTG domain-containing protein [Xanthobacteraceae bacterium]